MYSEKQMQVDGEFHLITINGVATFCSVRGILHV